MLETVERFATEEISIGWYGRAFVWLEEGLFPKVAVAEGSYNVDLVALVVVVVDEGRPDTNEVLVSDFSVELVVFDSSSLGVALGDPACLVCGRLARLAVNPGV